MANVRRQQMIQLGAAVNAVGTKRAFGSAFSRGLRKAAATGAIVLFVPGLFICPTSTPRGAPPA